MPVMFAEQHAAQALDEALLGYSRREVAKISPSDRFAHYTSRAAISKIVGGDIGGKRFLWLRNSRLMNDFTEVEWGKKCLIETLSDWRLCQRFDRVLNAIHPNLGEQVIISLDQEHQELGEKAFLMSLALHNENECRSGKLSMWRAYGGEDNACLIFNTAPFLNSQSAYETVLSPVMYGGTREFAREFEGIVYRLESKVHLLKVLKPEILLESFRRALTFAVLSTKHSGFHEETEWRVIHQHSNHRPDPPSIRDPSDESKLIYQIPIENRPEGHIWGAELGQILDRIVVGPVKDVPETMAYYIALLMEAGVSRPEERVMYCEIPFRRPES